MMVFLRKTISAFYKLCIGLAFLLGAVPVAGAQDKVAMRINFSPWGMHGQYFAGIAQGIYKKAGIDLDIRPPSAGQQNEVFIGSGREQFGLANVDSFVKARASGLKVKAIMVDQPNSPLALITLKSSGIAKPADLKGKKLGRFQTNAISQILPILKSGGLTEKDVNIVTITRGAEVQLLAAGEVDAILGFGYGQALTLEEKGFPVNVMSLKDYGLNTYGTVIYTSEMMIEKNPDLVQRFVQATVESLVWTRDHKRDAVAEVIKAAPDRDLDLETRKLEVIFKLYQSPDFANTFGVMTADKWASTIDFYEQSGDLPKRPDANAIFTNQFIEKVPAAKDLAKLIAG